MVVWLLSGFFTVPPGHVAFGKRFGKVLSGDMGPGLQWHWQWPVGEADIWPAKFPFRLTIGLTGTNAPAAEKLDPDYTNSVPAVLPGDTNEPPISASESSVNVATANAWHGAGSQLSGKASLAEFLAGDQNFIKILITVTYNISDPYVYHYRVEQPEEMIASAVLSSAREYVAHHVVDDLLSRNRSRMERFILEDAYAHLQGEFVMAEHAGTGHLHRHLPGQKDEHVHVGTNFIHEIESVGITLQSVNLIDIHPPEETIVAFRDVSSAMEDRHRSILDAEKVFTLMIPQAAGNALVETRRATAQADGRILKAGAESTSLSLRAEQLQLAPGVLRDSLWFETMERALAGRETYILPPGVAARDLTLWRQRPERGPLPPAVTNEQFKAKNYP